MQIINLNKQPQHIAQLALWHHQEWAALNPGRTLKQRIEYMQSYLDKNLIPSTFVIKHQTLMGSAAIVANDMETRPELTPWLASVFVAPQFRNRGVGSAVVQHVMQQAQAAGIPKLYLFTPDRMSFYARLGWHIVSEEEYRGHRVTIMCVEIGC
ncbi:MAG: GNAT family N-acetyltransferase [Gammaproteobacteria bacterium]